VEVTAGRRCVIVCSTVVVLTTVVPGAVVVLRIVVPGAVVVLRIVVLPGAVVVTVVVLAGVVLVDVVLVVVVSAELPPAATVAAKSRPATNIAPHATSFITLATHGMMTAQDDQAGQQASNRNASSRNDQAFDRLFWCCPVSSKRLCSGATVMPGATGGNGPAARPL
jgi:hypothetical protein